MDCAACARKVENAVRQLAGVNQVQVLFATENWWWMPTMTSGHKLNLRCKSGLFLRDEQASDEPQESRLKENLPLITLIVMMAISWGWSSSIIRLVNWRLSRPRWLGCTQLLVRHYG